jgi:hypothetical protein
MAAVAQPPGVGNVVSSNHLINSHDVISILDVFKYLTPIVGALIYQNKVFSISIKSNPSKSQTL